jgi:uncharacterized RDD family membrane protein YckC
MIRRFKNVPLAGAAGFLAACSVCLLPAAATLLAGGALSTLLGGATDNAPLLWTGIMIAATGLAVAGYVAGRRRSTSC